MQLNADTASKGKVAQSCSLGRLWRLLGTAHAMRARNFRSGATVRDGEPLLVLSRDGARWHMLQTEGCWAALEKREVTGILVSEE